jgi:cytochrome P450
LTLLKQACWTLIDLATHPEWREKCKKEIGELLSRHVGDSLSSSTLSERLGAIPVLAWEDELPILDACTRESQRIAMNIVALRRNLHEEVKVGGQVVKPGDFLAYSLADVHLNPEYYPDPYKYDPGRWLRPDPVPNGIYPFIGWGAGRHLCPGMKVGKLEMKLIAAVFLVGYEFDLVDKDGKLPDPLPVPNRNDIHHVRVGLWITVFCIGAHRVFPLSRLVLLGLHATSISRGLCAKQAVVQHLRVSLTHHTPLPWQSNPPSGEGFG